MNSLRHTKLLVLAGLSTIAVISAAVAQTGTNLASASATTGATAPIGTFRGGLDIIGCNGPGCRGGILATFTNDGHVKLKWKSEEEAFKAMQTGQPWAQEKSMESAGLGQVRTNRDGSISFDNGSYNRFDNCQFDGRSLTRCHFSRVDNGQAVAVINLTKVQ